MKIKSVYVFGPIHLFGKNYLPVYKKMMKLCKKYFSKVVGTYPDFWNFKGTPRQFYKETLKIIKCDLFIGEVSSPSHGVGMELQMAVQHKIPVIAVAKEKTPVSIMVLGLPNLKKVIRYKNEAHLLSLLEKEFQKMV